MTRATVLHQNVIMATSRWGRWSRWPCSGSATGRDHDLNQVARVCHVRLHAGARGRAVSGQPLDPDAVHGVPVADVLDPDLRRQEAGLVGSVRLERRVDLV